MIIARKLRDLPLSAASGLVIIGNTFYVVADDALHLGVFRLDDPAFTHTIRLRDGQLPSGNGPSDKKLRKQQKPDFEALLQLPPQAGYPHGALLALGSGSKANRQQGVLLPLDAHGQASDVVTTLDFAPLFAQLALDDCNIEGAVVCGEQLVLLQRGNQKHEKSALVVFPLAALAIKHDPSVAARHLPYVAGEEVGRSPCEVGGVPRSGEGVIIPVTLPMINGVRLGFTDGLSLPNGNILFAAVAEATDDSYNDGACLGAAIGEITPRGELLRCGIVDGVHKIEGIALDAEGCLYAVTDADDPQVPAALLQLEGWA